LWFRKFDWPRSGRCRRLLAETRKRRRLPELEPHFAESRPGGARDFVETEDLLLDRLAPVLTHSRPDDDDDVVGPDRGPSRFGERRRRDLDLIKMRFVRKEAVGLHQSAQSFGVP